MFALSALYEGFARGLVSLHTPPLLGRKPSSAKSRVSISSKLIEIKRLQPHYFGHLRKTGGRGSYQLPILHPLFPPHSPLACPGRSRRGHSPSSISCISPAYELQPRMSLVSPTYAKTGGCTSPRKNVGAPTFFTFPLISRTFSLPPRSAALTQDRRNGKRAGMKASATWKKEEREAEGRASSAPTDADAKRSQEWPRNWPPVCYINTVLHAYCASPSQNGTYQNPGYLPGARPAGMSPFCLQVPRCRR